MSEIVNKIEQADISQIAFPFKTDFIDSINIKMERGIFNPQEITFTCYVYFKNGNTSGSHRIKGTSFEDCFIQLKAFVQNL